MGLDRLSLLLADEPAAFAKAPVLVVAALDAKGRDEALKLVTELRRAGRKVELDTKGRKVDKVVQYAAKVGAKYFVALGERELSTRVVKLKHLSERSEREVPLDALAAALDAPNASQ